MAKNSETPLWIWGTLRHVVRLYQYILCYNRFILTLYMYTSGSKGQFGPQTSKYILQTNLQLLIDMLKDSKW